MSKADAGATGGQDPKNVQVATRCEISSRYSVCSRVLCSKSIIWVLFVSYNLYSYMGIRNVIRGVCGTCFHTDNEKEEREEERGKKKMYLYLLSVLY